MTIGTGLVVGEFNQNADSLATTESRSTKSHETTRKGRVFRDSSCNFVDRSLTVE
jgi:hypothetical protein